MDNVDCCIEVMVGYVGGQGMMYDDGTCCVDDRLLYVDGESGHWRMGNRVLGWGLLYG